jgi:TatD DNase family protein
MRLFDTHCHLDMKEFRDDLPDVLDRAARAGVARLLLAACDEASSYEVLRIARENPKDSRVAIIAAAGVHPHEASSVKDGLPDELTDLTANKLVAAVGETGLDFHYDNSPRDIQSMSFERHIDWARHASKPLIVHLRNADVRSEGDAYKEAIALMKVNNADECGGVIHCFSGDKKDAKAALDLGFYISFAGPVTYPKAENLREAAAYVPPDRLLCETDSPYLAPQGHRGKRNEPAFVSETYGKVAEVRGMTTEALAEIIWVNGERLFG